MEEQLVIKNSEIIKILKEIEPPIKIGKLIGKGGQKHVYGAITKKQNKQLVFKLLKPSENFIERVKREIRAIKLINHPNIPKVINTNIESIKSNDELVWILEEYIDGISLREALKKDKKFSIKDIVRFFDTMFSILKISESKSIIHRDIKPENIMIDKKNNFWLIDFGIARHLDLESITETDNPFGPFSLGYSAAEQFRNRKKDINIKADLFSVGVVAAEMILGKNPYLENVKDILQLIKKIEQQPLPLLKIDGDSQYFLAKFIKTLGDNRMSRRPENISEAIQIFGVVKNTLKL